MAKPPKKPKGSRAHRRAPRRRGRIEPATPDALADLLNPAINKGTAGLGSGTGQNPNLQPPPDNSFDRRKDFSAAHTRAQVRPIRERFRRGAAERLHRLADQRARSAAGEGTRAAATTRPPRPPPSGEKKDWRKYRLPRADLPTQPGGFAGMASQQSLEQSAARGPRRNSAAQAAVWTPHRPPRPEKSEGGQRFVIKSDFEPKGDQPHGDQGPGRGRASATTARRCCSASPARARPSPWPR